jgi:hypothetical protein
MMHLKTGYTWRQIVKTPQFEYCNGMKLGGLIPFIENRIKALQNEFPESSWNCPFQPGNYSSSHVFNFTFNLIATRVNITQIAPRKRTAEIKFGANENGFMMMELPITNGIYRNVINITTKNDPVGMQVSF